MKRTKEIRIKDYYPNRLKSESIKVIRRYNMFLVKCFGFILALLMIFSQQGCSVSKRVVKDVKDYSVCAELVNKYATSLMRQYSRNIDKDDEFVKLLGIELNLNVFECLSIKKVIVDFEHRGKLKVIDEYGVSSIHCYEGIKRVMVEDDTNQLKTTHIKYVMPLREITCW